MGETQKFKDFQNNYHTHFNLHRVRLLWILAFSDCYVCTFADSPAPVVIHVRTQALTAGKVLAYKCESQLAVLILRRPCFDIAQEPN